MKAGPRRWDASLGKEKMSNALPLIRSASLLPFLRWMQQNNRPNEAILAASDLENLPYMNPLQPIAMHNAFRFLKRIADVEGPDIGCRVVSSATILELALIGRIALGARTPREALERVATALPYHCSHEIVTQWRKGQTTTIRELISFKVDIEAVHIQQQYTASHLRVLCEMNETPQPVLAKVCIIPHPEHGLAHLSSYLGPSIVASDTRALSVEIANSVLDRPYPMRARDRTGGALPPGIQSLRGDDSLAESARPVLIDMMQGGQPTIERLAAAAGVSTRTLQRRLAMEKTSFTELLDDIRAQTAIEELSSSGASIGSIAATLGFASQAGLTRAMHRWQGAAPKEVRKALHS